MMSCTAATALLVATLIALLLVASMQAITRNGLGRRRIPIANATAPAKFLIIGGGTAGAIVASRLSQRLEGRIVILERGDDFRNDPTVYNLARAADAAYQRPYSEVLPLPGLRSVASLATMYGGGSAHNYALVVRGSRDFYDNGRWATVGLGYDALLPAFRQMETYNDGRRHDSDGSSTRGHRGPLQVTPLPTAVTIGDALRRVGPLLRETVAAGPQTIGQAADVLLRSGPLRASDEFSEALLSAMVENAAGLPIVDDYNTGVGPCACATPQLFANPGSGTRSSTSVAYLTRTTLRKIVAVKEATVERIIGAPRSDGRGWTAAAVAWRDRNGRPHVTALEPDGRLVLCAGALRSPTLLQTSGVPLPPTAGDGLATHCGPTVVVMGRAVPGDHDLFSFSSGPLAFLPRASRWQRDWQVVTLGGVSAPDREMIRKEIGVDVDEMVRREPTLRFFTLLLWNLRPRSRGRVVASPDGRPTVDLRLFSDGGLDDPRSDISSCVDGLLWLGAMLRTLAGRLPRADLQPLFPPAAVLWAPSADRQGLADLVRAGLSLTDHYVGTLALGTVVRPSDFSLTGSATNIHVVDASVLPEPPDANTQAPVCAVAEMAAERIAALVRRP